MELHRKFYEPVCGRWFGRICGDPASPAPLDILFILGMPNHDQNCGTNAIVALGAPDDPYLADCVCGIRLGLPLAARKRRSAEKMLDEIAEGQCSGLCQAGEEGTEADGIFGHRF